MVRKALLAGEIDLYVEYTGNAGFFFNRPNDPAWKDLQLGYELGSKLDLRSEPHRLAGARRPPATPGRSPCGGTSPLATGS